MSKSEKHHRGGLDGLSMENTLVKGYDRHAAELSKLKDRWKTPYAAWCFGSAPHRILWMFAKTTTSRLGKEE
jgi:hypothetical protein